MLPRPDQPGTPNRTDLRSLGVRAGTLACAALAMGALARPALAQDTQLSFEVGVAASNDDVDEFGAREGTIAVALRQRVSGFAVRFGVQYMGLGPPPCPDPPESQGRWSIDTGAALIGRIEATLPVHVGDRLRFEPFVGAGIRRVAAGEIVTAPNTFATPSSTTPEGTLGASIYAGLTDSVELVVTGRGMRHFWGAQTLQSSTQETRDVGFGSLDSATLTAGLAIRLP